MLSDKHVAKFQELYRNRFGKEIRAEEAREKGVALINFLKIIARPMNEKEFRELEQRNTVNS